MLLTNSIVRWRNKLAADQTTRTTNATSQRDTSTKTTASLLATDTLQVVATNPTEALTTASPTILTTATVPTKKMQQDWQLNHKYTLSEVQQHSSLDDCWMVIFDKVYNITEFVNEHPGGDFILLEYAGRDATHPFLSSRHGSSAYKMLDKYWIGILVDEELYYSNNSSYCSVYSSLSWRSTPTLEEKAPVKMTTSVVPTTDTTTQTTLEYEDEIDDDEEEEDDDDDDDDDNQSDLSDESDAWTRAITRTAGEALSQALASRNWFPQR
jgi:cytochrome b involved in lipid metabolism